MNIISLRSVFRGLQAGQSNVPVWPRSILRFLGQIEKCSKIPSDTFRSNKDSRVADKLWWKSAVGKLAKSHLVWRRSPVFESRVLSYRPSLDRPIGYMVLLRGFWSAVQTTPWVKNTRSSILIHNWQILTNIQRLCCWTHQESCSEIIDFPSHPRLTVSHTTLWNTKYQKSEIMNTIITK